MLTSARYSLATREMQGSLPALKIKLCQIYLYFFKNKSIKVDKFHGAADSF